MHLLSQQTVGVKATVILLPQATFAFSGVSQAPIYIPPQQGDTHQTLTELGSEEGGLCRLTA